MHRAGPIRVLAVTAALLTPSLALAGCANDRPIDRVGGPRPDGAAPRTTTTTPRSATTDANAADAAPGAADVGDPITPGAGNGGYDVSHYDVDLAVAARGTRIDGSVTITATATTNLSSFHLDLRGLDVATVTVDGHAATTAREGDELIVTPERPLRARATFTTVVDYGGAPTAVPDPSAPGTIGWLTAPSGSYVAGETVGAKSFLPCNDHPSDKATFTFALTAPATDTVIANGVLSDKVGTGTDETTWTYDMPHPMATYLVQIAVGDYDIVTSTGPHGLPLRDAIVRSVTAPQRAVLADTAKQIEFYESLFGPFPFATYGLLVADAPPEFALETQTLTLFPASWFTQGGDTSAVMAHELAHQWFGDAVTPSRWQDIWLNEGFATYAEWMWSDHQAVEPLGPHVQRVLQAAVGYRTAFGPVADPKAATLFAPNQYDGAAIVLHALRLEIGDTAFFGLLRSWVADHLGANATTADFEAAASKAAGRDLTEFFRQWLHSATVPALPG